MDYDEVIGWVENSGSFIVCILARRWELDQAQNTADLKAFLFICYWLLLLLLSSTISPLLASLYICILPRPRSRHCEIAGAVGYD